MQMFINKPQDVVDEMVQGVLKARPDMLGVPGNARVLKAANVPIAGKVAIVTGGGSGHKPAFLGYVGKNMVDAVAVGEIFSSPPAKMFYDAFKAADAGRGVACLYGNYAGDNMNVRMAIQMAEDDDIVVKTVVANDDVPSAPNDQREKRRGVAGEIFMWKMAAAAAAQGADLDEVIAVAQKAIDHCRSMGVGLAPCTIPEVGHPNFEIAPGTMEVGIGHHGEPGIAVVALESADEIAQRMVDVIVPDLPYVAGDEVAVLLSGLGRTAPMELYILYSKVHDLLSEKGLKVYRAYVGDYFTSLDMAGATLTLLKLDDQLKGYLDVEVDCMGLTQLGR